MRLANKANIPVEKPVESVYNFLQTGLNSILMSNSYRPLRNGSGHSARLFFQKTAAAAPRPCAKKDFRLPLNRQFWGEGEKKREPGCTFTFILQIVKLPPRPVKAGVFLS